MSLFSTDYCISLALASSSGVKSNRFNSSPFFLVLNALCLRLVLSFLALDFLLFFSVDYPVLRLIPVIVLYMECFKGDLSPIRFFNDSCLYYSFLFAILLLVE